MKFQVDLSVDFFCCCISLALLIFNVVNMLFLVSFILCVSDVCLRALPLGQTSSAGGLVERLAQGCQKTTDRKAKFNHFERQIGVYRVLDVFNRHLSGILSSKGRYVASRSRL